MYHPSPVSFHESGHVLVAFIYHRGPIKAELTGDQAGKVSAIEYDESTKDQITEDIEISLSGGIAEFLATGTGDGIDDDLQNALNHLRKLNPTARIKDLKPYIAKVTEALSSSKIWPKIRAVAEQLQRKRSLDFNDIDTILRQDYEPSTPPHAGAKIKFAANPQYRPEKILKALAVNKANRPYHVLSLQELPI